jgi:hypothetical protein
METVEKILVKYELNGNIYEFVGDIENGLFDPYDVSATKNGEPAEDFGRSWAGVKREVEDTVCSAFAAYFNDDQTVKILEICEEAKAFKNQNQSYTNGYTFNGRAVPDKIITPSGDLAELTAIVENGSAYYVGTDNEASVCLYDDGSAATDIWDIFVGSFMNDFRDGNLVYTTDAGRNLAKQYEE